MSMKSPELIFGMRAVMEAIRSGKEIEKILIKKGLKGELHYSLLSLINQNGLPYQVVPIEKINRITRKNHQGVLAFISLIEYAKLDLLLPALYEKGEIPFLLILDGITDVRNFGAIARIAECAGTHGIILPEKGSAMINSDAIKTSAGALHTLPVCRVRNMIKAINFLAESGLQIIAATERSDELIYNADLRKPTVMILGSEEKGIRPELIKEADVKVRIPVFGRIDSLNVSAAAAILAYEVVRQRSANDK